jgi:hypothetical protein
LCGFADQYINITLAALAATAAINLRAHVDQHAFGLRGSCRKRGEAGPEPGRDRIGDQGAEKQHLHYGDKAAKTAYGAGVALPPSRAHALRGFNKYALRIGSLTRPSAFGWPCVFLF